MSISKSEYKKVFKKEGCITEEIILHKDLPEMVQKMFQKKGINYVEHGICPDMSNFRGYWWDKTTDRLTQKTGSKWEFRPFCAYLKE
jgi:hypothetical protein